MSQSSAVRPCVQSGDRTVAREGHRKSSTRSRQIHAGARTPAPRGDLPGDRIWRPGADAPKLSAHLWTNAAGHTQRFPSTCHDIGERWALAFSFDPLARHGGNRGINDLGSGRSRASLRNERTHRQVRVSPAGRRLLQASFPLLPLSALWPHLSNAVRAVDSTDLTAVVGSPN